MLTALGLLLVLAWAPLGMLVGNPPPPPPVLPSDLGRSPGVVDASSGVTAVPVGLPGGAEIHTLQDVLPYAVRALGPSGAAGLVAVLSGNDLTGTVVGIQSGIGGDYPYRYPPMDAVLDAVPPDALRSGGTALGAALTLLAAQPEPDFIPVPGAGNAAPAAYAVLDRVRAEIGDCAPRLDLLLLLASDPSTDPEAVSQELASAEAACPHDVTPGWLVGQGQLHSGPGATAAATTMARLVAGHPTSIGALTGLGDAYLAAGLSLQVTEPFTARQFLRTAVATYQRAVRHGGLQAAAAGLGHALIALGEPSPAIPLLDRVAGSSPTPGYVLELLVAAEEAAHRYGDASTAARRLADRGAAAYPNGTQVIPAPHSIDVSEYSTARDLSMALSLGADRLIPFADALVGEGGAGGMLDDVAFIPAYRQVAGVTGTDAACASWAWRRDALLAGQPDVASQVPSEASTDARPAGGSCGYSYPADALAAVAGLLTGGPGALDSPSADAAADNWQNLLRWAGDLPRARSFVGTWQAARGENSYLPALRSGEIAFLQHRFDDAAADFDLAGTRSRLLASGDDLTANRAALDRGAALMNAGRTTEAITTLRPLVAQGVQGFSYQKTIGGDAQGFAIVSYYASSLLADQERVSGRLPAASEDYAAALAWDGRAVELFPYAHLEAVQNNAALTWLALGDTARATQLQNKALAQDPQNPVLLMTAGFIDDRRKDVGQAVRSDRAALRSDPGAYPVANDLGVELARQGHPAAARDALGQAVGARPDYALGWFNLGVLESAMGPVHLLPAQHAFATAYGLDPSLRNRRHELTIDAKVYRTALDLSKPLPPHWSLAQLQRPAPVAAVGLLALLGVTVGLARSTDRRGPELAATWLDAGAGRVEALPLARRFQHAGWAVLATTTAFVLAALHRSSDGPAVVVYALGVLALSETAMGVRVAVGRHAGVALVQRSWFPGLLLGLVTGAVGFPWAPLPVVEVQGDENRATRVHLAAPVTLGLASLVLFLEFAWTHTPLTEWWAVASLIMSASLLLPVGPLDGAHAGKAGVAAGAGIISATVLVAVGLL